MAAVLGARTRVPGFTEQTGAVAIILVTFLLKLLFYPLSDGERPLDGEDEGPAAAPSRTCRRPTRTTGEARSRAMMDSISAQKVNRSTGWLPIVIRYRCFWRLYWVLLESMGDAPGAFAFWITICLARTRCHPPGIMAAAMSCSTSMNPAPPDTVQAKVS